MACDYLIQTIDIISHRSDEDIVVFHVNGTEYEESEYASDAEDNPKVHMIRDSLRDTDFPRILRKIKLGHDLCELDTQCNPRLSSLLKQSYYEQTFL